MKKKNYTYLNDIDHTIIKNNITNSKENFRYKEAKYNTEENAEIVTFINTCLKKKDYNKCFNAVKNNKLDFQYFLMIILKKIKKKLMFFINNTDWVLDDFPDIKNKILNNCFIYFFKKHDYDIWELKFRDNLPLFIILINTLIFNKLNDKAYTLIKQYNLEDYCENKDIDKFEIIKNIYILNDDYIAMDIFQNNNKIAKEEYLHLDIDFNFNFQKNLFFIDTEESFIKVKDLLLKSKILSFDFEFLVNYLPGEKIISSLCQISNENKIIFIFDLLSNEIVNLFLNVLNIVLGNTEILKLGIGIKEDFKLLYNQFNRPFTIRNLIDIPDIYNCLTGNNYQSLQKISEYEFKKLFSKFEQTNDWLNRPLRKSQIHYAAWDAYILIEIYNKLLKEYKFEEIEFTDNFSFD